jgi:hypothetical protein
VEHGRLRPEHVHLPNLTPITSSLAFPLSPPASKIEKKHSPSDMNHTVHTTASNGVRVWYNTRRGVVQYTLPVGEPWADALRQVSEDNKEKHGNNFQWDKDKDLFYVGKSALSAVLGHSDGCVANEKCLYSRAYRWSTICIGGGTSFQQGGMGTYLQSDSSDPLMRCDNI